MVMRSDGAARLAWEISSTRPDPAFFGAHVLPGLDLREHMRSAITQLLPAEAILFLDTDDSRDYLEAVFKDDDPLESSEVIFFEDALAPSSHRRRIQLNRGRELLRRLGKTLVFAESRAGSPESLDDLRDLLATFRDIVDLRPAASEDDYLWDTGSAFGLSRIAGDVTTTRGAMIISAGIVHRKSPQAYRCPRCGGELRRTEVTLHFHYAPTESAEQVVPGYVCDCGETWPEPRSVRSAHQAAFKV